MPLIYAHPGSFQVEPAEMAPAAPNPEGLVLGLMDPWPPSDCHTLPPTGVPVWLSKMRHLRAQMPISCHITPPHTTPSGVGDPATSNSSSPPASTPGPGIDSSGRLFPRCLFPSFSCIHCESLGVRFAVVGISLASVLLNDLHRVAGIFTPTPGKLRSGVFPFPVSRSIAITRPSSAGGFSAACIAYSIQMPDPWGESGQCPLDLCCT
ncbi:hypothetical protein BKA56DRAFT_279763 [Ilyonectria sp. MPI-CAGE-AT-0026]|nr:hypothetical protein BKA56DRAFT_279763 [Ilyonectria sp. MPI-CAGE-AT-0026]